ncbi:MAG: Diaminobutyrate--2-oxoglutarate transaminase [Marinobacterium sp. xm-d-530]|nr:MAG: Diaminobutyrate--2-oxoglutarate transaminase [Marinobacterium sp. xm-d-530]
MSIFEKTESAVRTYSRSFPVTFSQARGAELFTSEGKRYLDFLAGAGSLNYGHNHPELKDALIDYVSSDGIAHGLDMQTEAKSEFLEAFQKLILEPRGMGDFKVQFTGPTGANAVEAALKLARKVTGRTEVIAFTNGFHGVTAGALAATGNGGHRAGAGIPLSGVTRVPYANYMGDSVDTLQLLEKLLNDHSSGVDKPAAVILEAVQGEGGLNVASNGWLQRLEKICRAEGVLLILDDIQAGCGRTGDFFSFEESGIKPDIITLSKSLSGYGLPMAVTLFRPELDIWKPGEHNGTFRGNNHAFVTAKRALDLFWSDTKFAGRVKQKSDQLRKGLRTIIQRHGRQELALKGRGLMSGIECDNGEIAGAVCREAFKRGLVIETSGNDDHVVKCLVPLIISEQQISEGLSVLEQAFGAVFAQNSKAVS